MTRIIQSLDEIADHYEAIVLDQWGVLHDGSSPYPGTIECLDRLASRGHRLAVLSNSGKRSDMNANRISSIGFPRDIFETVMTSGEALWHDISSGKIEKSDFLAIERSKGDASAWASGLSINLVSDIGNADAILLMGLPDGSALENWQAILNEAYARQLPLYCSNPDLASPRAGGLVISPGTLAHNYQQRGGTVFYYGKPHRPVFDALKIKLGVGRLLMIGDSLDHDITGADTAGWDSLLVQGGLYASNFKSDDPDDVLHKLVSQKSCPYPTFMIETLK